MLKQTKQWWKARSAAVHRLFMTIYMLMPVLSPLAAAPIAAPALAATLTQTFKSQGDVSKGNIVSLDSTAKTVSRASTNNITNLYGVVANSGDVNFINKANQGVEVGTTGVLQAFVSTLNGPVVSGDPITVSSVEGVGEKAIGKGRIIGFAQGDLNDTTGGAKDFQVAGKSIKVSLVAVKVEAGEYNPGIGYINADSVDVANRSKLQQIADSVAGKPVKTITLLAAGLILLIAVFSSVFLVISSSYASMLSLGRNPLSEPTILRSLLKLVAISIGIFIAGILLSFAIIRAF